MKSLIKLALIVGIHLGFTDSTYSQKIIFFEHLHCLKYGELPNHSSSYQSKKTFPNYLNDPTVVNHLDQFTQALIKNRFKAHKIVLLKSKPIETIQKGIKSSELKKQLKATTFKEADYVISLVSHFSRPPLNSSSGNSLILRLHLAKKGEKKIQSIKIRQRFQAQPDSSLTGDLLLTKKNFIRVYEQALKALFLNKSLRKKQ